ncbi:hypothetical protein [Clostridium sp. BNL1100]|uniref:hypothetical protein n=1 Tax=Clostridium sp. BNL1100 TaxID=755731 RepID=UPI00024A7F27|nr:hypothetical protein [Clostridium sp. BNL1100]AEY65824.1 hypothetical protein Clo1100_1610 [Clostridium sp. BNL1100]
MQFLDEKLFEFLKSENLLNINFYSDSEKIVFHDTKINKKFLLVNNSFQKFFSQSLEEYGRKIDRYNTLKDYILEYSRLCGFIDGNDKLKMYKNMGFFQNSYAEFVIIQRDYQIDIGNLGEFFIGKQKIEISNASSMFKVIFKYLEENNDFR